MRPHCFFDEQKARRLIQRMLAAVGWQESDLDGRAKGDPTKARIAARVRAETPVTWGWIAKELRMGHRRTAVNAVRRANATPK